MTSPAAAPSAPPKRIEKIEFEGQTAWIKRPEAARSSVFSGVHRAISRVLPTVLRPTNAVGGIAALHAEADRLRLFAAAGLAVPQVLSVTDDNIVLSDCGVQLRRYLQRMDAHDDIVAILKEAAELLAQVHRSGLAHGRPFLRDMARQPDGTLALLDLEEDPVARMDLPDAQARDAWLFLMSAAEFYEKPQDGLPDLLAHYLHHAPEGGTARLHALARSLRPFRRLMGSLRVQNIATDARGAYWSIRILENFASGRQT